MRLLAPTGSEAKVVPQPSLEVALPAIIGQRPTLSEEGLIQVAERHPGAGDGIGGEDRSQHRRSGGAACSNWKRISRRSEP